MQRHFIGMLILTSLSAWPAAAQTPRIGAVSAAPSSFVPAGTQIVIPGSDFGDRQGKSSVWLGGKEAPVKSWSNTQIVALAPVGAYTDDVVVRIAGKQPVQTTMAGLRGGNAPPPSKNNGILVNDIKVYDDQALQQALNAARAQLAAIQVINQAGINGQVGSLQGATLSQTAFSVSAGGPPLPGITSTANTGNTTTTAAQGLNNQQNSGNSVNTATSGTNNQTTSGYTTNSGVVATNGGTNPNTVSTVGGTTSNQTQGTATSGDTLAVTGPSTQITNTGSNQTVVAGPSLQTVTTQAAANPTPPTIAPSTLSLPTSFSPGASNILNEQLELTYEITGYQLLLEGALSDHYLRYSPDGVSEAQLVRPRVTIGVPVTISALKQDEDAVAEIILTVRPLKAEAHQPPVVTAILPRDKTYNVASITDKSVSVGGAIATQLISLGVSALWGHKAYFVVQDQDTVALQLPREASDDSTTTRFGWQIRPVLGQKTVTTGMRNCFVQLAFPELPNVSSYGSVHITTRWRKYDRKKGIVLDEIPGTTAESDRLFDIQRFNLHPEVREASYEDNADGSVTVFAQGDFLNGTFVKVGQSVFVPGSNAFQDPAGIRFTLPAIQLATHNGYMVDRGGDDSDLVTVSVQTLTSNDRCLDIPTDGVGVSPAGAGLTKVTVKVSLTNSAACIQQKDSKPFTTTRNLVAVVANQVFGLRNAPFLYTTGDTVSFLVPTGLLQNSRHVMVKRLLWGPAFESGMDLDEKAFRTTPVISQATVVFQDKVNWPERLTTASAALG
jgi:hypothetical protein